MADISLQLGVTGQNYLRRRKDHGGLKIDQAWRLKELEQESVRLRRALSDIPPLLPFSPDQRSGHDQALLNRRNVAQ